DQVEAAATGENPYIGDRIADIGLFDEVGDIEAGDSAEYELEVPLSEIGVTGAQGVYPVGVHLLATDAEGRREDVSIARAATFLPWLDSPSESIPAGLVWSFILDPRGDNATEDTDRLTTAVGSGGRL